MGVRRSQVEKIKTAQKEWHESGHGPQSQRANTNATPEERAAADREWTESKASED